MPDPRAMPATRTAQSVGALLRAVGDTLNQRFSVCTVQGELSGFARAASGHCYFTLKDADGTPAALRCAMFRRAASLANFAPADGQQVEVRGRLGLYEPRGELQFVVESMQRAGAGALFEQFQRTRLRLEAEGLFDPAAKRPLPAHPRLVGLVTSLGGAVLHDIVSTLARRAPHVAIVVYPSAVQGPGAPAALCAALDIAARRGEADLLIVCRGGGSLEDLWAFNDEQVVRAIARSPMPVVSAVGHETDVTLADFAADQRAPTPTAAAEIVAPAAQACLEALAVVQSRLERLSRSRLDAAGQRLDRLCDRLARPGRRVEQQRQHLAHAAHRLDAAVRRTLEAQGDHLTRLEARLDRATGLRRAREAERLAHLDARVRALDPRRVLARGYAWLADTNARPVMSVERLAVGERLLAVLADGSASVRVERVDPAAR